MKNIRNDIASKDFKRIYLLFGEEEFLVKSYRNSLRNAVLSLEGAQENYSYFNGNTGFDVSEMIDLAMTYPFFSEKRLIVIDNSGLFGSDNILADSLSDIPESTVIVITENTVDKRTKLFKEIKQQGYVCEFTRPEPSELETFVVSKLSKAGLRITGNDCSFFLESVGNDLFTIVGELDKLSAYCMGKEAVRREDILAVCTMQVENRIFELVDSLLVKDKKTALKIYFDLIALRESPIGLIRFILKQYNRILLFVSGFSEGRSDADVAASSHQPEWLVRKYRQKLRNCSKKQIVDSIEKCLMTESNIKNGSVSDVMGLELLVQELSN